MNKIEAYEAIDGTIFSDEEECSNYEILLKKNRFINVFASFFVGIVTEELMGAYPVDDPLYTEAEEELEAKRNASVILEKIGNILVENALERGISEDQLEKLISDIDKK